MGAESLTFLQGPRAEGMDQKDPGKADIEQQTLGASPLWQSCLTSEGPNPIRRYIREMLLGLRNEDRDFKPGLVSVTNARICGSTKSC